VLPDFEAPPVLCPPLGDDEADAVVVLEALVVLGTLVVSVDWLVDVLAEDAVEELLSDPPHPASRSASDSPVRIRPRWRTVRSIDAGRSRSPGVATSRA
jgi:hypothetical protein